MRREHPKQLVVVNEMSQKLRNDFRGVRPITCVEQCIDSSAHIRLDILGCHKHIHRAVEHAIGACPNFAILQRRDAYQQRISAVDTRERLCFLSRFHTGASAGFSQGFTVHAGGTL